MIAGTAVSGKVGRNVSITFATSLLSSAATALAGLVVAHASGAKGAGIFALARVVPTVIAGLLGAGIMASNVYLVGARKYSTQAITETSVALALVLGLLGWGGWTLCEGLLKVHFFRTVSDRMVVVLGVAIPLSLLRNYLNSIQQGLQTFTDANLVLFAEDFCSMLLILPLLAGVTSGPTAHHLIVFAPVGGLVVSCALAVWCLARRRVWSLPGLHRSVAVDMIRFGAKSHAARIANTLSWRLDVMLLSTMASTEVVGYYAVATKVAEAIRPLCGSLNVIRRPLIASLSVEEGRSRTVSLYRRFFAINLTAIVIMYLVSGPLIIRLFGVEFAPGIPACHILLIGLAMFGTDSVLNGYYVGIARPEFNTYAALVGLVITVVGDLALIPHYTLMGAAVTSAAAYTTRAVLMTALFLPTAGMTLTQLIGFDRIDVGRAADAVFDGGVAPPVLDFPIPALDNVRMRLLFVNSNRSATYGGVERWMIDAAAGMATRGHAAVLLGRPGTAWLSAAHRAGLRVRSDIRGTWAARVWRVRAAMRSERPHLVIAKAKKAVRMAAWGRSAGAGGRVVLFFGATHELDARRWVDRFTWRVVDAGIVVAHGAADWYLEAGFGPRDKLHVLWKGVDLSTFAAARSEASAVRAALGLEPDQLAVGTVGRLAWQKGLEDLFTAIRRLRARLPRARFFVVGGGRDAAEVAEAAADPELGGAVTLLGQRNDVPALLAAMDIFVQSSRREAMAQTTLEAMAAARPVVSTRTVGADEAIEDGVSGLLVPVADPLALADRVAELAFDPLRRAAMGDAARRRVAEHFTIARMLDRFEAICGEIAGDPGARPYQTSSQAGAARAGAPGSTSSTAPP